MRVETRQALAEGPAFLTLDRRRCVLIRESTGCPSPEFSYDAVLRKALDAAIVVAYCIVDGCPNVYLRSCVRPPLCFRSEADSEFEAADGPCFWELPAGLIDEAGPFDEASRSCAARELHEEIGFELSPADLQPLGSPVYPLPAMIAERQVFFQVEVDPKRRGRPLEDGSPLESEGQVICIPLDDALDAVAGGKLPDSKTELGLRRFAESWRNRES